MERHVTEAVYLKHLAFVYGIVPVDIEHAFHQGGYLVHFVAEEGDDARAYDVCDVVDGTVLVAFQLQLAGQTFLGLHAPFDGCDGHVVLFKRPLQYTEHHLFELLEDREPVAVLVENHLAVHVELHLHGLLSDGYDVGETCDVEDFLNLRVHVEHHHLATAGEDALLEREENAEPLRRGVGHARAVDVDVGFGRCHKGLDVGLELVGVGGVEAPVEGDQGFLSFGFYRYVHILALFCS